MAGLARVEVGIDCLDPLALATFWSGALGYEVGKGDGTPYVDLTPPRPDLPNVYLQRVPEPKTTKARLHLDLYVDDPHAEVARLEALGARRVGEPVLTADGRFEWQVMADPEGTELCVCADGE